ncbi:MAG TPA: prolyl oligopeptidase family serine peptidase [Gemmataceae bacterium]|nr:prolyl oligopeptidase family serine peptidase [Gemmataceae bacterium]
MSSPRRIQHCVACALLVLTVASAAAADPASKSKQGDAMIDKYLADETARLSKRFLDGATTLKEWQERRPRLRQEYFDMLGLWPLPAKTPLKARVTGTRERGSITIELLHFQSRPGLYVTGNLYRPKRSTGKLPAVLYVCGHSGRGRDGNKTAFQDHGMWFASNGYVCLIIDTLQLGEVPGVHHGTYNRGRWWWQARGYTPAGVECWNGIRAIDYLQSRPDVDPDKLAVTGISGGGAATFWIAAADERVRCAVPVSGMSDLESYVSHKIINHHCDCMLMINTYGWEWTTIAALIAPRPMLFCNSDHDTIFPMDGNERIIMRLRRLYKMYDKPDLVDAYVSHGGHDYRPGLRLAIFKWINKHIKNETGTVKDADFKPLPGKKLRVFPEDKDVPKDAINSKIDETFVPLAQVKMPEAGKFEEWKKGLMQELRAKSFRTFPERVPRAREIFTEKESLYWLHTESGILVGAAGGRGKKESELRTLVILGKERFLGDVFKQVEQDSYWFKTGTRGGVSVEGHPWTTKSPPNYVERSHALLGKTVDEGRVWDIVATVRAFDWLEKGKFTWRVAGRGQAGILAAYAALFEPSIKEVIIFDPPVSHRDGPTFLNVLRVLDIPEALGLLAPRPLTLVNAKDKAFDRTAQIYKLAGAAKQLTRK